MMTQKLFYFCIICCCFLSCQETPVAIPDARINDYALYDAQGDFHRLSTYNDSKAIVLFVQGNSCPIVRNALTDFHKIVDDYQSKGFTFFMVNSNMQDDRASIAKELTDFKFEVPVLYDDAQLIADALDITITAEAIVLDPTSREIMYRGPLNNRLDYETQKATPTETYLRDALNAIATNQTPIAKEEVARGCRVTRRKTLEKDTLTFTHDIAPILTNHCVRCHVDGGVAPWSMTDYDKIVGWSAMIEQVMLSKRMPPWKADPAIGSFDNSFAIAEKDRRKLVRWIQEGMPYGTGDDPLKRLIPKEALIPETTLIPDTTIVLKKEIIPATGIIDYRHQRIKFNLPEGKWLAGVTIVPGNPKVVHHATLASSSKPQLVVDRPERQWIDNLIAVVASGTSKSTIFPENSGIYIDKDIELIIQTHYTTTGREEEDVTKIHLYYHKEKPAKQYYSLGVFSDEFEIQPYEKRIPITAEDKITEDVYVHSIFPHMHFRGKQMKITATKPDGEVVDMISVPDFDFNWQLVYNYTAPIFLPKGTVIKAEGVFDNSFQNPLNPDPSKEVTFGYQSSDEMFMGLVNYTIAEE
ncbi:redoxin domain-containing protein [Dokdonia ponticola]|uniref:Redoxin domain-containing protein n=1 Tax=Dokdonia ponticola TaxID=2041041 RepID=A0ABV9HXD5_9FLAO